MHSDRHARGGVKFPGEEFLVIFLLYMKVWSDFMVQGVELYVILVADFIFNIKYTYIFIKENVERQS